MNLPVTNNRISLMQSGLLRIPQLWIYKLNQRNMMELWVVYQCKEYFKVFIFTRKYVHRYSKWSPLKWHQSDTSSVSNPVADVSAWIAAVISSMVKIHCLLCLLF